MLGRGIVRADINVVCCPDFFLVARTRARADSDGSWRERLCDPLVVGKRRGAAGAARRYADVQLRVVDSRRQTASHGRVSNAQRVDTIALK